MTLQLQDYVPVLMTPKQDLLEPQAIDQRMDDYNATEAQNNFAAALNPRDDCCIFTDIYASLLAVHIIPFSKQDDVSSRQLPMVSAYSLSTFRGLKLQLKSTCWCRAD